MEEPGMTVRAVCCSRGVGERNVTLVAVCAFENWGNWRNLDGRAEKEKGAEEAWGIKEARKGKS